MYDGMIAFYNVRNSEDSPVLDNRLDVVCVCVCVCVCVFGAL